MLVLIQKRSKVFTVLDLNMRPDLVNHLDVFFWCSGDRKFGRGIRILDFPLIFKMAADVDNVNLWSNEVLNS